MGEFSQSQMISCSGHRLPIDVLCLAYAIYSQITLLSEAHTAYTIRTQGREIAVKSYFPRAP